MKPDYKNWVPKGMLAGFGIGFIVSAILCVIIRVALPSGMLRSVLGAILGILAGILFIVTIWMACMYRAFSYDGKRQLSRVIVEGTAAYITIPDGGKGLDVGCGSGALTIAVAKRNPKAQIIGMDRWGKEYASFNKALCENNAKAEGVTNVSFTQGNAVKLDYPDETFDAVTSNYVYHNIVGVDKQDCLRETLRVLKKGGVFALHDIMSQGRYGDMQAFAEELRQAGYEKVELLDTTSGMFMSKKEAFLMELSGSTLLVGKK